LAICSHTVGEGSIARISLTSAQPCVFSIRI
jgi:hypothetical protein